MSFLCCVLVRVRSGNGRAEGVLMKSVLPSSHTSRFVTGEGSPLWLSGEESACQCGRCRFDL